MSNGTCKIIKFQLTAARRRLGYPRGFQCHHDCFNSQPPEGGWPDGLKTKYLLPVSTHSRPKAAGVLSFLS